MSSHQNSMFHKITVILLAIGAISAGGYAIKHTVSCFLSSFVIAYLLDPLIVFMEKKQLRRVYGIILIYFTLGLFLFFAFLFIVPFIITRWDSLLQNLPLYLHKMKDLINSQKGDLLATPVSREWSWLLDSIYSKLDSVTGKFGSGVYSAASSLAFNLFNLIISPILVFFMLHYKNEIISGIKIWLPFRHKEKILLIGREINSSIGGYLRGQLTVSAIVAVFATIALYLLDIDYSLINGLFAGAASILPFVGVILATLPPIFFAYVKFESSAMVLKVICSFAAIYFLEGYLVKPLVFRESMNLNPLLTIVVVMAFGELMGFWGILLAIPIAAALKIFSIHWRHGDFIVKE